MQFGTLEEERAKYAENWSNGNALRHESSGDYEWMASFLDGFDSILEIGTGDGRGTLALSRRSHKLIISIDENPSCLEQAKTRLVDNGISCVLLSREKIRNFGRDHAIEYRFVDLESIDNQVILMSGDILNDSKLIKVLSKRLPIDAIACWLIGTHNARQFNKQVVTKHRINSPVTYRLSVQNSVYEFADRVLRGGGRLQIVDRGEVPSTRLLLDDLHSSHQEQASTTSLIVDDIQWKAYSEEMDNGITMVPTPGILAPGTSTANLALNSVCSTKP